MSKISIAVPTYNGSRTLKSMLETVLSQNFSDFEVVISDDNSTDNSIEVIESFNDPRVRIIKSNENIGYPGNMRNAYNNCSSPIVFLMAQDDLLADNVIEDTVLFFENNPDAGALSRPYYAFDKTPSNPIRYKKAFDISEDEFKLIDKNSNFDDIHKLLNTMDQLSGLSYRKSFVEMDFHDDVFPCHVYPFLSVLRSHKIGFSGRYTVAVRVNSSQCISTSAIYNKSPVESWLQLFDTTFPEEEYKEMRLKSKKRFVSSNWIGLLQIRNYSERPFVYLFREYIFMLKERPQNILHPYFILTILLCVFTPRFLLVPLVNFVKNEVSSKTIASFKFILDKKNIIKVG